MKVKEALRIFQSEEAEKLIDKETLAREALEIVQEGGIVFLDELDKVVVRGGSTGPDVRSSGTSFRSSRGRSSRPATARSGRTTSSSSRRAPSAE